MEILAASIVTYLGYRLANKIEKTQSSGGGDGGVPVQPKTQVVKGSSEYVGAYSTPNIKTLGRVSRHIPTFEEQFPNQRLYGPHYRQRAQTTNDSIKDRRKAGITGVDDVSYRKKGDAPPPIFSINTNKVMINSSGSQGYATLETGPRRVPQLSGKNDGVLPFTQQLVGPSLSADPRVPASGGFNSGAFRPDEERLKAAVGMYRKNSDLPGGLLPGTAIPKPTQYLDDAGEKSYKKTIYSRDPFPGRAAGAEAMTVRSTVVGSRGTAGAVSKGEVERELIGVSGPHGGLPGRSKQGGYFFNDRTDDHFNRAHVGIPTDPMKAPGNEPRRVASGAEREVQGLLVSGFGREQVGRQNEFNNTIGDARVRPDDDAVNVGRLKGHGFMTSVDPGVPGDDSRSTQKIPDINTRFDPSLANQLCSNPLMANKLSANHTSC